MRSISILFLSFAIAATIGAILGGRIPIGSQSVSPDTAETLPPSREVPTSAQNTPIPFPETATTTEITPAATPFPETATTTEVTPAETLARATPRGTAATETPSPETTTGETTPRTTQGEAIPALW